MSIPLILDTDFSSDVDDLGDVALACAMHKLGVVNLLCVSCDTSADKSPGAISATMKWWGVTSPTIGTWKGSTFDPGVSQNKAWRDYIYDTYDRNGVGLASTVEDGNTTMRRALAARQRRDAVIITTGPLNAMQALMNSTADSVSSMTGMELLAAKCKVMYAVVGIFPTGTEWNAQQHPASANDVAANWPTPIVWTGIEIGNTVLSGGPLTAKAADDLMRNGFSYVPASNSTRPAWGQLGIMAAAQANADFGMVRGTAAFNASTGANTWTNSSTGNHYYLTKSYGDGHYANRINKWICANVSASPLLSDWSQAVPAVFASAYAVRYPGAPTSLMATAGNAQVALSW
ncbi:MAG: hypothetical protein EBR82_64865, partial [Caulobacteraceae bacterium]|nr:hypothetical protein [Caulobacteraceae bacterium]